MSIESQKLLDALDGIAFVLDAELRLARIGIPHWNSFIEQNPPQGGAPVQGSAQAAIGRHIGEFIAGDQVRATFTRLYKAVLTDRRGAIRLDYRCDAPSLRRNMRLMVTPLEAADGSRQVLCQSIELSSELRPSLALFGAPVSRHDNSDILTLCAICARVAWPVGAPLDKRAWIEPTDYYRRGGAEVSLISHGLCEPCFAQLELEEAA